MLIKDEYNEQNIAWMEENVVDVPSNKFLYKIVCFFLGKRKDKLTYKELYILYTNIYNFKKNDIIEVKKKSIETLIDIYYYNKGVYPEIK